MIDYRPFLNTDIPALVEIWNSQDPHPRLSEKISRSLFDQMVFAKPYFDPAGLIVAISNGSPIGFVHAGFGPKQSFDEIDFETGILAHLLLRDKQGQDGIIDGLWKRAAAYYARHGTKVCYAGSKFPYNPFYHGLYGGSRIPGVLDGDSHFSGVVNQLEFRAGEKIDVLQVDLTEYRPSVSRAMMTLRRQYQVSAIVDPLLPNWWECCTFGWAELYGFRVVSRNDQTVVGRVMFWDIQPLSSQWEKSTMGLVDLEIEKDYRQSGLATFLVSESLRHLASQGVGCIEVQLRQNDEPACAVARKIGFKRVATGTEMMREIS